MPLEKLGAVTEEGAEAGQSKPITGPLQEGHPRTHTYPSLCVSAGGGDGMYTPGLLRWSP